MAKSLDDGYAAGSRGFAWLKLKPAHTLDLVVIGVERGSGRRRGWLSNLHLAARDPRDGSFAMLGKTFKGMTDEMLAWQTTHLQALALGEEGYVVHVKPELVVEIAFSDVQQSPTYPAGMALRFARVKRYRTDKSASDRRNRRRSPRHPRARTPDLGRQGLQELPVGAAAVRVEGADLDLVGARGEMLVHPVANGSLVAPRHEAVDQVVAAAIFEVLGSEAPLHPSLPVGRQWQVDAERLAAHGASDARVLGENHRHHHVELQTGAHDLASLLRMRRRHQVGVRAVRALGRELKEKGTVRRDPDRGRLDRRRRL